MHCFLFGIVCMDFVLRRTAAHTCTERARGCQLDWVEINKANRPTAAAVCSVCKFLSWPQTEDCRSPASGFPLPAGEGCLSLLMSKTF